MYKNLIKSNYNPQLKQKYTNYKNKLVTLIRSAEKKYYSDKLLEVKDNKAKTWKIMNEMCGRNSVQKRIESLKINDVTINDPLQIANKFNDF